MHPSDPWPQTRPKAPVVQTTREFAKQFLSYAQAHTKAGTLRFYKGCLDRILRFSPLADVVMTAVNGELVAKYAQWRRGTTDSVLTVNGELRTIRRLLNLAEEWSVVTKAPTIHELPGGKGRDRVITFVEEAKYLSAAHKTLRDVAVLAVDTGLRPNSEIFPLEWSNVCLEPTEDATKGFIHVRQGKTDSAVRNVPLTPRTREMLLARKQSAGNSRYVFPGSGTLGHLTTIQHAHARLIREAKLEPFEFYCWRHTFGTRCAEAGLDRFTVARLMGHSSPRVAERYYIHVTEQHVTAGFEKLVAYQATKQLEAASVRTQRIQ